MPTRDITCSNCEMVGEIEVHGFNNTIPSSNIFRHRGHNPLSGNMYYQCPACGIVLLVDPMAILGDGLISVHPRRMTQLRSKGQSTTPPWQASFFKMLYFTHILEKDT